MKKVLRKIVSARELPKDWQTDGEFSPDERVMVWVEPEDAELSEDVPLKDLMELIGRRAQKRGLTREKLDAILND